MELFNESKVISVSLLLKLNIKDGETGKQQINK